jgi:hypothetical protein
MHRNLLLSVLAPALCGAGCHDAALAPPDADPEVPPGYTSSPDGDGALVPTPGFPGRSARLGSAFRTRALGVLAAPDGSLWAAHADENDGDIFQNRALVIERFDPQLGAGAVVAQATITPADAQPSMLGHVALCSHPSGEITLAVFVSVGAPPTVGMPRTAALVVTRFAADGTVVRTAHIDEAGARVIDGHAAYMFGNDIHCASDGEDLLLITSTQDLRLYRLAADLSVRWSRPVMPLTPALIGEKALSGARALVAVAVDGGAVTAITLRNGDREAFAHSFGVMLPATSGDADVLVTRFGADGTRVSAGLLGGPGVELAAGLRVDSDRVSVLAQITVPTTHDIDLVLLAGDPAGGHTERAIEINLCNEDEAFDVIPAASTGGFVVAGSACSTPGDTSTQVGYVATIGPDGRRQGVTWFTGDRATQVQALAPTAAGELVLAGIRNGPTTAAREPASNEGWIGVVGAPANR